MPGSVSQTTVRCPKNHPLPRGVPLQARAECLSSKRSLRCAISSKLPLSNNWGDERGLLHYHACPTLLPFALKSFVAVPPTASVQSVRLVTGQKKGSQGILLALASTDRSKKSCHCLPSSKKKIKKNIKKIPPPSPPLNHIHWYDPQCHDHSNPVLVQFDPKANKKILLCLPSKRQRRE